MYDTYIFDLDGTITDTMTVWLDIIREALIHFDFTPPDDKTLARYSHNWRELSAIGFPEEKFGDFAKFIYEVANKRLPEANFQKGAYETLQKLKDQGKRIAIYSSIDRAMFAPAMEFRNLYALTEIAVAGTDIPKRKPHASGVLKALQDLQIPVELYGSAVYVGDKDTDILAAQNAGIDSILYFPASHGEIYDLEELKKFNPTHIITDWRELLI